LIKNLVTIIIPCSDSLLKLKSTIESLVFQTRIRGTRVLVADFGSKDGSIQYAQQVSSELRNTLVVEPFDFKGERDKVFSSVTTPYVFYIAPGKTFDDRDFIMDNLNKTSKIKTPIVYTEENVFGTLLRRFKRDSEKRENVALVGLKNTLENISFIVQGDKINVDLSEIKTKTVKI